MIKELSNIKLFVGLGNPGKEYEHTYHNVGKLFADYRLKNVSSGRAASEPPHQFWCGGKLKFQKPTASKNFEYVKTARGVFARPLLFMNESGAAVQAALRFFDIAPEQLLVIHDDSDIELGKYKISFGRGAGGHRGAESIIQKLGTKKFWRLRIGIRPPAADKRGLKNDISENLRSNLRESATRAKASELVLKKISGSDEKILSAAFKDIESEFFTSTQNLS